MAKKRKTALPKVTVLAYNRRDLLAFVEAVEKLRLLVEDLRLVVHTLKIKKQPKSPPPTLPAVSEVKA